MLSQVGYVTFAFVLEVLQRAGTPLLSRQAKRVGIVHPGEQKAPGRPYSNLPIPKGAMRVLGRDFLQGHVEKRQWRMGLK